MDMTDVLFSSVEELQYFDIISSKLILSSAYSSKSWWESELLARLDLYDIHGISTALPLDICMVCYWILQLLPCPGLFQFFFCVHDWHFGVVDTLAVFLSCLWSKFPLWTSGLQMEKWSRLLYHRGNQFCYLIQAFQGGECFLLAHSHIKLCFHIFQQATSYWLIPLNFKSF